MPKLKTKTAMKKRFKITATGKVMRKHAFKNHILTKKSSHRIRHLRKLSVLNASEMKLVDGGFPYGGR